MDGKKRPEEKVREGLESARDAVIGRIGEKRVKKIIRAISVLLALAALLVVASFFFKIGSIEVTGDVTMFNEGEVIRAAQIYEGNRLFAKSSRRIERNIRAALPLAESVKVRKSLSGKVSIDIEFADVYYYTKVGDLYYALDEELRVLDFDESRSKYSAYNAVYVRLPELRDPKKGEALVFYDTVEETDAEGETLYEVKKTSYYDFVVEFLAALKESGYHTESRAIDLREKFEIELVYADKFVIKFGNSRDLDVKFRILSEINSEGSMDYVNKGVIDLSDPSKAFACADETLDLTNYFD